MKFMKQKRTLQEFSLLWYEGKEEKEKYEKKIRKKKMNISFMNGKNSKKILNEK